MSMSLNNNTTTNNSPTSPHGAYGRPLASRSRSLLVSSELLQPEVEVEPTLRGSGSYMSTKANLFDNANASVNAVPTVYRATTAAADPSESSSSSSLSRIDEARKQRTKESTTYRKLALVSDDLEPPSFDEERSSYIYSRTSGSLLRNSEVDDWQTLPEILRVEDDDEGEGRGGGFGNKKDKGKNRAVDGFSKSFSSRHSGKPSERDVPRRSRPLPLPSSSSYASSSSRRQCDNLSHHYEARGSFDYNVDPTRLSVPDQSMFESSRTMSRSTPQIRTGNIGSEVEAAEPEAPMTPAISVLPIPAFKGFQPTDSSNIRSISHFPPTPKSMTMPTPIRVSTPVVIVPSVVPAASQSYSRARSNSSVTFMGSDRGLGLRAASSSASFGMARSSSSSMSVPRAPPSNFIANSGVGERARAASVASALAPSTPFPSALRPESRFSSRYGSGDVPKTVSMLATSSARFPTSESAGFLLNKNPKNSESSSNSSSNLPSSTDNNTDDSDTDIEPNEAWKAKLRENIQRRVTKMKAQKRASHATFMQGIVNEEDRRRFRWEYEQSLSRPRKEFNVESWAQYQYQTGLDRERERRRVRIVGDQRHRERDGVQYMRWIPVSTARSA